MPNLWSALHGCLRRLRVCLLGGRGGAGLAYTRPVDVVLVHPEIPHNAGCAGRLTAAVGARLHLVEPLGFSLEDRYLKRAGLDYWPQVDLVVHPDLDACLASLAAEGPLEPRLKLFSARGGTSLFEAEFTPDDVLVFGCESGGLPSELLERSELARVYVPIRAGIRDLFFIPIVFHTMVI